MIFLISINGFSQCDDGDKLELVGTYYPITQNYISFELKHKDTIYRNAIFYPVDIKTVPIQNICKH